MCTTTQATISKRASSSGLASPFRHRAELSSQFMASRTVDHGKCAWTETQFHIPVSLRGSLRQAIHRLMSIAGQDAVIWTTRNRPWALRWWSALARGVSGHSPMLHPNPCGAVAPPACSRIACWRCDPDNLNTVLRRRQSVYLITSRPKRRRLLAFASRWSAPPTVADLQAKARMFSLRNARQQHRRGGSK
ncbi:hypothetical protein FKP32DRAFT_1272554 [Trametes sanguinea]|nr:hypothetical protein FKP32DRAFT_1272554 [Trametes sanguinea]